MYGARCDARWAVQRGARPGHSDTPFRGPSRESQRLVQPGASQQPIHPPSGPTGRHRSPRTAPLRRWHLAAQQQRASKPSLRWLRLGSCWTRSNTGAPRSPFKTWRPPLARRCPRLPALLWARSGSPPSASGAQRAPRLPPRRGHPDLASRLHSSAQLDWTARCLEALHLKRGMADSHTHTHPSTSHAFAARGRSGLQGSRPSRTTAMLTVSAGAAHPPPLTPLTY